MGNRGGVTENTLAKANMPRGAWSMDLHSQENGTYIASMNASGAADQQTGTFSDKYFNGGSNGTGANSRSNIAWSYGVDSPAAVNNMSPYIVVNFEIIAG